VGKDATAGLLAAIVELRLLAHATREPETRARLRELEWRLRPLLEAGVAKRQAAAQLGVTVAALDKWIARGRLPVIARGGNSRRTVETRALLELAERVEALRRTGLERGLLAEAFRRLDWPDDPDGAQVVREEIARLPRPNVSVQQLRADYERIPPKARVAQLTQLHRSLNALAQGRR
jgi:DNA-binding transcriptional MerR regulator